MQGRIYSYDEFSGRVGRNYEIHAAGHRLPVKLDAVQELPGKVRQGGSFRLEFLGPHDPALGQGVYPFHFGDEGYEIFIVPIAREPRGIRYEALFF